MIRHNDSITKRERETHGALISNEHIDLERHVKQHTSLECSRLGHLCIQGNLFHNKTNNVIFLSIIMHRVVWYKYNNIFVFVIFAIIFFLEGKDEFH